MPFPEAKRVIYKQNPLDRVICQLRFPPILKIDNEIPANFQDEIRKDFPKFTEKSEWKSNLPEGVSEQLPMDLLQQMLPPVGSKNYEFCSEDEIWKVNLTRTFVALTANKYERWESFKEMLMIPFDALQKVYAPNYFSRVGLRYIDIIQRSRLGLDGVAWHQLLKPYITGILGSVEICDRVRAFESVNEIKLLDDESMVRIATRFVQAKENDEICYMIDSDFSSSKKIDISEALDKLDYFHVRASRLIQWSITERLHNAMQPEIL